MKNIIVTTMVVVLTTTALLGQEFLGVKVDGKKETVIAAFKSKGFAPSGEMSDNVVTMKGVAAGKNIEINIVSTPLTKTVWKFSVYLPKQSNWYSLKAQYEEYLKLLTEKYGEPTNMYNFFSSPYEEGDGYEMTAVYAEKCHYAAFWKQGYAINISQWKQVNIVYENDVNSDLNRKEKDQVNKNIF